MSVDLALSCNSCQIEPSVWKAKNFSGLSSRRRTLKSLSPKLIKDLAVLTLAGEVVFDTTHQILLRLAVEAKHFLHIGVDYICRRQYIEDLSVGNNSLRVFIIWELCRRLDNRHDCAILLTEFLIAESYRRVNICARVAILDSLALGILIKDEHTTLGAVTQYLAFDRIKQDRHNHRYKEGIFLDLCKLENNEVLRGYFSLQFRRGAYVFVVPSPCRIDYTRAGSSECQSTLRRYSALLAKTRHESV